MRTLAPVTLLVLLAVSPTVSSTPTRSPAIYGRVSHLGWIVRDAAATAEAWRRLGVRDASPVREEAVTISGLGGTNPVRVRTVEARIGSVRIDWIQPLDPTGVYQAFLKRHGEGVHHVGYTVPSPEALDDEARALASIGAGPVGSGTWQSASHGPARFVWLDTPDPGGVTFELASGPGTAIPPRASDNDDPFNRVTQFAFVVRDVAAVSEHLARLGFSPLAVEPNVSLDRVYRGAPGTFEMLLGWGRSGTVPFEWIQPTKGPSVYYEYLQAHGEGFHHLGFDVPDMDAALARLRERGLAVTMSGGWDVNGYQGRFAYLDTERFGGVTIELLWNKPR